MKIQSIYTSIFTLFQPSKLKLNKFLPWLPPSFTTIELSSRVKILFCLTLSTFAIYKVKEIASRYWTPPPPPPPVPIIEQPQPTESQEEAVNTEEVDKNLKYLQEIFAQRKIPEKYQKTVDDLLTKIVREENDISIPDFNYRLILISTFDVMRKDPSLKTENPHLLEILKNVILCEFQKAIKKDFYQSTKIQILTDNARLYIFEGEKAIPSNYTKDQQANLAQCYYDRADTLPPPILIKLCLHFIDIKSFEKAAYLYVLGITRIEQDWAIYSKHSNVFKEDLVKKHKDLVLDVKLDNQDRKAWDKALKAAKKKELPVSCHYDFRWPIFSMLMDDAMKKVGEDKPFALEGEPLFKMCDRGMILQSICLQEFAADPRFQSLD